MLPLPILNVHLQPCSEDWQQMTPMAQGRHCASCQRTVLDFTTATQTDLEAARATSSDGRICGRFRAAQLAQPPRLRPRLRRFLVALVLVCGLGLTSGEAWAQVRKAELNIRFKPTTELQLMTYEELTVAPAQVQKADKEAAPASKQPVFGMVEQMPVYRGGQEALLKFLANNLRRPDGCTAEGRVFVSFTITTTGGVRDAKVVRSLHPALDAEALRVVNLLDGGFEPGQQNGRPIDIRYTIPITFKLD